MYKLTRVSDGKGDQGYLTVHRIANNQVIHLSDLHLTTIKVGDIVEVGAIFASMFGSDTWWRTTPITEVVSYGDGRLVFNTGNSSYLLQEVD